jgi:hypothetical protein
VSSAAQAIRVQELKDVANGIVGGRVLLSFSEGKFKREIRRFLKILSEFDPENLSEGQFEATGKAVYCVIQLLKLKAGTKFYDEAIAQMTDAHEWIISGYSPSSHPSEKELRKVAEERAASIFSDPVST